MSGKRQLNVHLYVTPICNLQCKHCYYDSWSSDRVPERLLTIDTIAQVIIGICEVFQASFDVEGGEFFLREDIRTFFELVPSRYLQFITITTNGLAEIKVAPRFLRQLGDLRVSIEGHTDELQLDVRGVLLGPVLETCYRLQASSVPVTLRITLHQKNYQVLTEMLIRLMDLGFARFSLFEFQAVGRGRDHKEEYGLSIEDMETVLAQLSSLPIDKRLETLKLSLSAGRVQLLARYRDRLAARGFNVVNLLGVPSLTINYNGDLGVCPWIVGQDRIGTLRVEDLASQLSHYITSGHLDHSCAYCSAARIWYQKHE